MWTSPGMRLGSESFMRGCDRGTFQACQRGSKRPSLAPRTPLSTRQAAGARVGALPRGGLDQPTHDGAAAAPARTHWGHGVNALAGFEQIAAGKQRPEVLARALQETPR